MYSCSSCSKFLSKTPTERYEITRRHDLCANCLRKGHAAAKCKLRSCTKCSRKHNTLLHMGSPTKSESTKNQATQGSETSKGQTQHSSEPNSIKKSSTTLTAQLSSIQHSYVLLSTACIRILTSRGEEINCRAVLDSGSQLNFITEELAKKLQLKECKTSLSISGIGQNVQTTKRKVDVSIHSRIHCYSTNLDAYILPKIAPPQPSSFIDITTWPIPKNIELADPEFYKPNQIDLLIGVEQYYQLLSIGQIKLGKGLPVLQNTVFGWIVAGKVDNLHVQSDNLCGICTHEEGRLDEQVERFWKLEEVDSNAPTMSPAEKRCESYYDQTTRRNEAGRFIVRLPFAKDPSLLGESKHMALTRLYTLERKIGKNPELKDQYKAFMEEYIGPHARD